MVKEAFDRVKFKILSSSHLTPECWMVQAWGLPYRRHCDYLSTDDCGGYRIRKEILSGRYPKDGLEGMGKY